MPGKHPRNRLARRFVILLAALAFSVLAGGGLEPAKAQSPAGSDSPSAYWFDREAINPGLPAPGREIVRETPRTALETFVLAHRDRDHATAAHVLDLGELPASAQAARGPELARKLGEIMERRVWIDWAGLPDRPDGLREAGGGDRPLAGEPRRSVALGVLDLDLLPVTLRLRRVKSPDADPVWLISPRTVMRIDALHARHGPGWLEQMLPAEWTTVSYGSLRQWEWVALPVLLALMVLVLAAIRAGFDCMARHAPRPIIANGLRRSRTPVAVVAAAVTGRLLVAEMAAFSAPVTSILLPLFLGLAVFGVALAAIRVIDAILNRVTERYVGNIDDAQSYDERRFYTQIYALRRLIVLAAVVAGVGIVLTELHLLETVGVSLLASAGVLTIILGIAGQAVLGNIISSLQIALAKPIRIGDSIQFEGHWSYVEAIFYTFVRLRTWDNRRLIVPVKYFVSTPFENWSMQDATMTRMVDLILDHSAEPAALRQAFEEIAASDEDVMQDGMLKMLVGGHSAEGVRFQFYMTAKDPGTAWDMHARIRENILNWVRENHPEWWPRERELTRREGVDDSDGHDSIGGGGPSSL